MLTVKQRQLNLKHTGFYFGDIDGIEGPQTKQAYRDFQQAQKLTADGIYGPLTETALLQCIKELQYRLNDDGESGLTIDGLVGAKTIAAIKKYQTAKGLAVDGIAGAKTLAQLSAVRLPSKEVVWGAVRYFDKEEFKCECNGKYCNGYPADLSLKLVEILDKVRAKYGKPIQITSGLRCVKQNQLDGGIASSKHLYGKAADFWFSGMDKQAVIGYCYALGCSYAYTNRTTMLYAVHVEV